MSQAALELIGHHVLRHLTHDRPLFVAIQGTQGSGKSYTSSRLQSYLEASPHCLRVAVLSLDDLYLPRDQLQSLATSHPKNILWQGRGQPGTHDVALGLKILSALKDGSAPVELPRFDKSLFNGEGDRLPMDGTGVVITQPPRLDVLILEGWFVGFHPISREEILNCWNGVWKDEREKLGLGENEMGRVVDVEVINEKLKEYLELWSFFDVFVQLKPNPPTSTDCSQYAIVYKWRLQQEHNMKAANGGRGMSDAAVKSFVDRYIPGYVFFGNLSPSATDDIPSPKWSGKGLMVCLDEDRKVTGTSYF
ncbi:hypothetical protein NLJ89_g2354 [Agrocybe chaxingu]|uniref:P-loop containing nucleoside triphosphate hydrolase protein n=1 Tax=Agrocybe chaxingu TaxID=84603 RepID=A0A9W8MYW6_9AGAR|nr:hypothetical protein NLJ89_g2354 [Agrocybe chaxingu]